MEHIAILLATYNGEKYLREQLDSLYQQTFTNWNIYIHDDGSTDHTSDILNEFAEKHDNFIILDYPSQHGAKDNFLSMLQAVDADYYFFCDQDDKWCRNKIEKQITKIKEIENKEDKPILVFSDLFVVDSQMNLIDKSMWKLEGIHPEFLTTFDEGGAFEFVTGCTMLLNKKAKDTVVYPADKAVMHDSWITLCVLRSEGVIEAIHESLVFYRQHGNNTLGVSQWSQKSRFRKLINIRKSINANYKHYRMLNALGYGSIFKYLRYKYLYREKHHQYLESLHQDYGK